MIFAALIPALIFAYLGSFVRIGADDTCAIVLGQQMGPWDYMQHGLNSWTSAYSRSLLLALLAPLDRLPPMVILSVVIVLWIIGSTWLAREALRYLRINTNCRCWAIFFGALSAAAALNALPSRQSAFRYIAVLNYTLPVTLVAIYLALALWAAGSRRVYPLALAVVVGCVLCGFTAGLSEGHAVLQATFMTLCLLASQILATDKRRKRLLLVLGTGWLASVGSVLFQLTVQGIRVRADRITELSSSLDRSVMTLATTTIGNSFDFIGQPQAIAGFFMLLAFGLLAGLCWHFPRRAAPSPMPIQLQKPLLWLGFAFQLLWIPMLWSHHIDVSQLFGRFSFKYGAIIGLNVILLCSFALFIWKHERINALLRAHVAMLTPIGIPIAYAAGFVLLFAFAEIRSIVTIGSMYLFSTVSILLVLLTLKLSCASSCGLVRQLAHLALIAHGVGWICLAVVSFTVAFIIGWPVPRAMTAGAFLLVIPGVIWGALIGRCVKTGSSTLRNYVAWEQALKAMSLLVIAIVLVGIIANQTARIPELREYARQWDTNYEMIGLLRESGVRIIEVPSLPRQFAKYLDSCSAEYYGVDSITEVGDSSITTSAFARDE